MFLLVLSTVVKLGDDEIAAIMGARNGYVNTMAACILQA